MGDRFAWFLRWLAYCFVMAWPVDWWPFLLVLPYAGDYANCSYSQFCKRTRWSEKEQCFVVPDGACPYPIDDDDGSARACIERGHCGCDNAFPEPRA